MGTRLARGALSVAFAWAAAGWTQVVSAPAAVLNHAEGSVAYAPKGEKEWSETQARRTLQRGDRVWTDKGSRAELQAGTHALRMDSQTQLGLDAVGESGTQLSVMRGSVAASVTRLAGGENFEIGTPNLAVRARQPGEYRVDVDPHGGTTRVSVLAGSAVVYGEHGEMQELAAGQRVIFRDKTLARVAAPAFAAVDDFDKWAQARGRREPAAVAQAAPAVHPDTIARQYRELEAKRQAEVKQQLEELRRLSKNKPAGPAMAQAPTAAVRAAPVPAPAPTPAPAIVAAPVPAPVPAPAPIARAPAAPKHLARAPVPIEPRVVHVPAPRVARQPAAPSAAVARKAHEEHQRKLAQARRAEEEQRRAAAAARKEEERRQAVARKAEQDRKLVAARRAQEESKRAAARAAENERKLAAARQAEEERKLAEARKDRLQRLQAQAGTEEQSAREQRARREDQARRDAQARREEDRREEEARREATERRQRQVAEQWRREHEVWLRTQQPVTLPPARPLPQGIPARRVM